MKNALEEKEEKKSQSLLGMEVRMVLRGEVMPDREQPRQVFEEGKLRELAESIKAVGIRVPLQVHLAVGPKVGGNGKYVLIDGERRWRAAELAGVTRVPVLVVDTSSPNWEKEKLAVQVVLNQQHENLSALEEAAAYGKEIGSGRHTAESLYKQLGVSRAHLFGRLALNRLPSFAVEALKEGRINTSVAGLVAMVPGEKKQREFLEKVAAVTEGNPWELSQAMSFREAQELLEDEFCAQLDKKTVFDTKDEGLVPEEWEGPGASFAGRLPAGVSLTASLRAHTGSRTEDDGLGHRKTIYSVWSGEAGSEGRKQIADGLSKTGAEALRDLINRGNAGLLQRTGGGACTDCPFRSGNLEEYPEAAKRPNVCTQPACYHEKVKAHWVREAGAAVKAGQVVIDVTTYKRTKGQYVEAEKEQWIGGSHTSAKKELGKAAPPVILATTAQGLIKVYKREEAVKAGLKLNTGYSRAPKTAEEKRREEEARVKAQAQVEARRRLAKEHAPAVGKALGKLSEKEAWTLVAELVDAGGEREGLRALMKREANTDRTRLLCDLMTGYRQGVIDWNGKWDGKVVARWKGLGVDLVKLEEEMEKAGKAEKEQVQKGAKAKGARSEAAAVGEHKWTKTDLVSGALTNYKCELCGVKAVRYGVSWPPRIKGKRDSKKFGTCPGKGK